jgi:hypothetical protein
MRRGIEVQDLAAAVLDDERAVQNAERQSRDGEEIERCEDFAMIVQECEPVLRLGVINVPRESLQVAGDGGLGDHKPELQQFAVNAGSTPGWVVRLHSPD